MDFEIIQVQAADLAAYGAIPVAFQVLTGPTPFVKDYDAVAGNAPADWPARFDCSQWGIFAAFSGGQRIGGAIVWPDPVVAVLWDLRVHPECRGRGVGRALFQAAAAWARETGCRQMMAETQDINAAACRFYARQGCRLGAANRCAYPDFPEETQLLWTCDLT